MIVWLASYPRSGNTFFRVILNSVFGLKTYSIYDDKVDIGADKKTSDIVGHQLLPEDFSLEKARQDDKIYFIKTHEKLDERINDTDKIIYLVRDGRECILSYLKFHNNYNSDKKTLLDIVYGNILFGSWSEHIKSWSPDSRNNCLLIYFESLVSSPDSQVSKIAEFLKIEANQQSIPTFSELQNINSKFFRSGKKDSWKVVLSKEEQLSFWLKSYTQMKKYAYVDEMPDVFEKEENFQLFKTLSDENSYFLDFMIEQVKLKDKIIEDQKQTIEVKNELIAQKEEIINQKNKEISGILASKKYKLGSAIAYPYLKITGK